MIERRFHSLRSRAGALALAALTLLGAAACGATAGETAPRAVPAAAADHVRPGTTVRDNDTDTTRFTVLVITPEIKRVDGNLGQ